MTKETEVQYVHLTDEQVTEISKQLMTQGKLVASGFLGLWLCIGRPDNQAYREDIRTAFFAGAYHVFQSIMATMDEGEEVTAGDKDRLSMLNKELEEFVEKFTLQFMAPPQGNA